MAFLEAQAVRAVLLIMLAACTFAGTMFAGYAIFLALAPYMLPAWAALIPAAVLLLIPLLAAYIARGRIRHPAPPPAAAARETPDTAAVAMIAGMAKEKPLLAILFAGLLGAAGTLIQQKGRTP